MRTYVGLGLLSHETVKFKPVLHEINIYGS